MRSGASAAIVLSLLGAVMACASSGVPREWSMADDVGSYRFEERVSTGDGLQSMVLEGVFTVRRDTVVVDATPGPCRYDRRSTRGGAFVYNCADVTLRFDRDDPVRRSTYTVTVTVRTQRTVCVRYATSATGQRFCAQTRVEESESSAPRSGPLNPRRVE